MADDGFRVPLGPISTARVARRSNAGGGSVGVVFHLHKICQTCSLPCLEKTHVCTTWRLAKGGVLQTRL